jgi:hypothetical protein
MYAFSCMPSTSSPGGYVRDSTLAYSSPGRYLISRHSLHVKFYDGILHGLRNFRFHFALQLIDQRNGNCYWSYWTKHPSNWASHWSNPPLGASYSMPYAIIAFDLLSQRKFDLYLGMNYS